MITNVRIYADDTSLFIISDNLSLSIQDLQSDVDRIIEWSNRWLTTFNAEKTENLVISKKVAPYHTPVTFQKFPVPIVVQHKHLGMVLSQDLTWHRHIENMLQTVSTRLGILLKNKYRFSRKTLETLYFSFIRSVLDYGDVIYDDCPDYLKIQIEKIQKRAARIVTGLTKSCHTDELYREAGWTSLVERRRRHKLILYFKIKNGLAPNYLVDLLPQTVGDRNPYNVRNREHMTIFRCRTEYFLMSFFPLTTVMWNSLDELTKNCTTLQQFKMMLAQTDVKPPKWYYTGERRYQIIHCQLRNRCSSLNEDLFINNVKDDPMCIHCESSESTDHFIMNCMRFAPQRANMIIMLASRNIVLCPEVVLYGDMSMSVECNNFIARVFQDFIKSTKRFD